MTVTEWAICIETRLTDGTRERLRRKQPSRNDIWHLHEMVINIAGKKHWLRRAVDQDGYVLDEIAQSQRDT
ncbi:MAG: transposase, partial [Microvirga sp.]|nr:transposase [Microvirga sp.]